MNRVIVKDGNGRIVSIPEGLVDDGMTVLGPDEAPGQFKEKHINQRPETKKEKQERVKREREESDSDAGVSTE